MKEFDLEAAKSGAPVQLRNGMNARIVCFDKHDPVKPLVVLRETPDGKECVEFYAPNGKCSPISSEYDLVMNTKKYEGWVNIYGNRSIGNTAFATKEEAEIASVNLCGSVVPAVKIEWEE